MPQIGGWPNGVAQTPQQPVAPQVQQQFVAPQVQPQVAPQMQPEVVQPSRIPAQNAPPLERNMKGGATGGLPPRSMKGSGNRPPAANSEQLSEALLRRVGGPFQP